VPEQDDNEELGKHLAKLPAPSWESYFQLEKRLGIAEQKINAIDERLTSGGERFGSIEKRIEHYIDQLERIKETVDLHQQHVAEVKQLLEEIKAMLRAFENLRGTLNTMSAVGNALRWVTYLAAGLGVIWAALKAGVRP